MSKPSRSRTSSETRPAAPAWLEHFTGTRDQITQSIRRMVEIESPSDDKPALDRLGHHLAIEFEKLGGRTRFHRQKAAGDHLQVEFPGPAGRRPLLLLGHFDTVWPMGTLAQMSCHIEQGRLWGPGALDMKSGIALMIAAIAGWRELHGGLPRPVTVLLNTDEEVGSDTSRRIIENVARRSTATLVLEPGQGLGGALKTARKGVGGYQLKVTGRAAHAGVDFEKGRSAVLELARQVLNIAAFSGARKGLTVNVGLVGGGTRTNVIPAHAFADIDVRIARLRDASYIDRKMRSLRPVGEQCKLEVTGGLNRPPMERTREVVRLFRTASALAADMDWQLREASTGGGSDGNFTSALGVPTLDGMGGVGEGAHAVNESVVIAELPRRAALLAMMIGEVP
jgi:glutamate carboxypeptidase